MELQHSIWAYKMKVPLWKVWVLAGSKCYSDRLYVCIGTQQQKMGVNAAANITLFELHTMCSRLGRPTPLAHHRRSEDSSVDIVIL